MRHKDSKESNEPPWFDIDVTETAPYEFEITLLTTPTKEAVATRAERNKAPMSGGVAAFVGPPLIAVYRACHDGAWPDIRSKPAVAGQKATELPGDRYVVATENRDLRKMLDEFQNAGVYSRADIVKRAMMDSLHLTLENPGSQGSIH